MKSVSILDKEYCRHDLMKTLKDEFNVTRFQVEPLVLCVGLNVTVRRPVVFEWCQGSSPKRLPENTNWRKLLVGQKALEREDWYITAPGEFKSGPWNLSYQHVKVL